MLIPWLMVLGSVPMLYGGAEGLVRGSSAIAIRLGLTPLVIGLTVVAFGTSMPEMVISVGAARDGLAPIAVGNVVGSNIGNIALILGVCALMRPLAVHAQIIRLDLPILIFFSLLLVFLLRDDAIGRVEGALLVVLLIGYTVFGIRMARHETRSIQHEFAQAMPSAPKRVWLDLLLIAGGLGILVVGARLMVVGAVEIARTLGVSDAVIALTIVAIGTSLPELATSVLAGLKGQGDIAIGNIVGSCIFNLLGILGVASLVRPLEGTGMSPVDLGVMVACAVLLFPLSRSGMRLGRIEGGFFLAGYVAYLVFLAMR